jgi:hypothetical protein
MVAYEAWDHRIFFLGDGMSKQIWFGLPISDSGGPNSSLASSLVHHKVSFLCGFSMLHCSFIMLQTRVSFAMNTRARCRQLDICCKCCFNIANLVVRSWKRVSPMMHTCFWIFPENLLRYIWICSKQWWFDAYPYLLLHWCLVNILILFVWFGLLPEEHVAMMLQ